MRSTNLRDTVLGDFCSFKYGKTIRKSEVSPEGLFPVFSGYQIVGYLDSYMYEDSQLLVVCRGVGGTGDIKISPKNCSITNLSIIISPDKRVDKKYLYWLLKNSNIYSLRTGSAQPQITIADLERFSVAYHDSRLDQKAITHILDTLDKKIELNQKMNETLEEIAKTLFKSWFIDFDPVRAKAEGKPTGLSKEISDLFPDSFEDSELGEIPSGWKVMNISEVSEVVDCLHSKKPNLLDEGFNFLELKNIRDDFLLDTLNVSKISESDYQKWISRIEVCGGDLIITNVGRVGAVARVPDKFIGSIGRNITAIRPKEKSKNSFFLASYFSSTLFKSEKRLNVDTGTILDALNVKDIPKLRFFYPSSKILSNFEEQVSRIWQRREMILEENNNLSKLRDTLLPKLISGELKIPDAENLVDEAGV